jgi:hypothetical protein
MQKWEYCYIVLWTSEDTYVLCTSEGKNEITVKGCSSRYKGGDWKGACVVEHLGSQGWEAVGNDDAGMMWFKRPK